MAIIMLGFAASACSAADHTGEPPERRPIVAETDDKPPESAPAAAARAVDPMPPRPSAEAPDAHGNGHAPAEKASRPPLPRPSAGAPAWSLDAGSIVYERHTADRVNIYRYDAGTAAPVPLTTHRAVDQRPRWSPDGTRVAFHSDLHGADDVFVVNADGSGLRRLTEHPGDDFDPDWMPDGRLLFSSDRSGDQNIWLLDLDSGDLEQLTHYDGGRTGGPTPAPDGHRIAFSSDRMFSWQVYVLDLDDGAIERITGPLPGKCNPAWNPADGRIAYMSGGDLVGTDLRSTLPDGSDAQWLGSSVDDNEDPQFSEDGSRLVWVSNRDGNWEIYASDRRGAGEGRVSNTAEDERHPDLFLGARR